MHNRRKFITQTSLALGALGFLKPLKSIADSPSSSSNSLTILYTNGLSGQWQTTTYGAGGIKAVKAAVDGLRRKQQNILLVDSGNLLAKNSEKNIDHLHFFTAVKETGYDAITPGTSDLQHGYDYFSKLIEKTRINAVATNFNQSKGEALLSYRVVRKGAVKVGIIGIGSCKNLTFSAFQQMVATINAQAQKLKQQQRCQLVVCLSHLQLEKEQSSLNNLHLAKASSSIDVIISAHDDRMTCSTFVVKNQEGYDVMISHAGSKGTLIGQLDISFNEEGEKIAITARQVLTGIAGKDATAAFRKYAALEIV